MLQLTAVFWRKNSLHPEGTVESRAQLFKRCNLDQNYLDFEVSFFAIQDHVIHLTFIPVVQSWIGSD